MIVLLFPNIVCRAIARLLNNLRIILSNKCLNKINSTNVITNYWTYLKLNLIFYWNSLLWADLHNVVKFLQLNISNTNPKTSRVAKLLHKLVFCQQIILTCMARFHNVEHIWIWLQKYIRAIWIIWYFCFFILYFFWKWILMLVFFYLI